MNLSNRIPTALLVASLAAGCTTTTERGHWGAGAHWPTAANLKSAAVRAAKDPMTWAPLAGAALLAIGDADEEISEWAADKTPLFGDDAANASDTLLDITTYGYVATALLAPDRSAADKLKGLTVGAATMAINDSITQGLKSIAGRERPNGQDHKSFPSGHASNSATRATLAARNAAHLPLPDWARASLTVGLYSVAGATAWARVEAEKHHVTDVLVGNALGHFLATFMQEAFLESGVEPIGVNFTTIARGGTITVHVPLRGAD
ncbi:MAG: phosphatase PAP2 family protein [Gammaproteobacteria bacterium]|nr:phosphatase PAP2 family protein [Gammaproteobacteria bacterium]